MPWPVCFLVMLGLRRALGPSLACRSMLGSLRGQHLGVLTSRSFVFVQARAMHDDAPTKELNMLKMLDQIEEEGVQSEEEALDRLKELVEQQHKDMMEEAKPLMESRLFKEYDKAVEAETKRMDQEFIESDIVWSSDAIQEFHAKRMQRVVEMRQNYTNKLIYAEYWPNYISDEKIAKQVALEKCPKKKRMLRKVAVKFNWVLKRDSIASMLPCMPKEPDEDASAHERIEYQMARQEYESVKGTLPQFDEGPFHLANNVCMEGTRSDCLVERVVFEKVRKPVRPPRAKLDRTVLKEMREDFKQIQ